MKLHTFKRGIHPPDEKHNTSDRAIFQIPTEKGALLTFPLAQSLGAPCEPIVNVGDYVKRGQKIADSKAFVSAPIHSSTAGVVKEMKSCLMPNGLISNAIVIESDGSNIEHESLDVIRDYTKLSKEEILGLIREAGIVGMGGAGFPSHIKLNPPPDKKVDTILINGSECEPYLTNDHRVMLEHPDWLIEGVQIVLHIFKGAKGIIGIETNKTNAIKLLKEKIKDIPNVEIMALKPKYPQGSEKHLIYACLGREVPSGGLPADIGAVVVNVETCIAIQRAVVRGRPLMSRNITLTGDAVNNAGNYKVNLGTSYKNLIDAVGGLTKEPHKLISGGPMMGVAIYDLNVPVIKTTSGILCLSEEKSRSPKESNCIRCGRCVEICPAGLMPLTLNQYVVFDQIDQFQANNGLDCIECGACSFVCPAKRHLTQSIRSARRSLLAARKK